MTTEEAFEEAKIVMGQTWLTRDELIISKLATEVLRIRDELAALAAEVRRLESQREAIARFVERPDVWRLWISETQADDKGVIHPPVMTWLARRIRDGRL